MKLRSGSVAFSLAHGALCVIANGLLMSAVLGADLPIGTPLNIRNEAHNDRWLTLNPVVPAAGTDPSGVAVELNLFANSKEWQFLAGGQPGQVVIFHIDMKFILEAAPAPTDNDPAPLKLAKAPVSPTLPTPSQLWRIIETDTGPYLVENVQTGGRLGADPTTLISANNRTGMQLQSSQGPIQSNCQWRFYPANPLSTPLQSSPVLTLPAGTPNFKGKNPTVEVTVTLQGDGKDRLTALVKWTVTDPATGAVFAPAAPTTFPILLDTSSTTDVPGKKILLIRTFDGVPSTQTLSYSDPDEFLDVLSGPINKLPAVNNRVAVLSDPTMSVIVPFDLSKVLSMPAAKFVETPGGGVFIAPPKSSLDNVINCCLAIGDPDMIGTEAQVILEQLRFAIDVP